MLLCLHVLHNALQRWGFFSAARLVYLLSTVARRLLTVWVHTALWWSAWRGVTCYSSFSVLWCCPNTWGTTFPNNGGWSDPWTRRACRRVLMQRRVAHAQRKRYWIWSVRVGANVRAVRRACEQGGGDDILVERAACAHNTNTPLWESQKWADQEAKAIWQRKSVEYCTGLCSADSWSSGILASDGESTLLHFSTCSVPPLSLFFF